MKTLNIRTFLLIFNKFPFQLVLLESKAMIQIKKNYICIFEILTKNINSNKCSMSDLSLCGFESKAIHVGLVQW